MLNFIQTDILNILKTDKAFNRNYKNLDDGQKLSEFAKAVCNADPSSSKGYAGWILESYLDGGIKSVEDFGRVKDSLKLFTLVQKEKLASDIPKEEKTIWRGPPVSYCGIVGCKSNPNKRLAPFNMTQTTKLQFERIGLEKALDPYRTEISIDTDDLGPVPGDVIAKTPRVIVINPSTTKSAIFWGKGTKWCTASTNNNRFDHYSKMGPIYILVDRLKPKIRYQLHIK